MVKSVTGLAPGTYEERCEELGLETLEARRQTLDLVQAYKIIHGVDDVKCETLFNMRQEDRRATRAAGGGPLLTGTISRLDLRHHFFSQRVVDKWNKLSMEARSAKNVHIFKRLLRAQ